MGKMSLRKNVIWGKMSRLGFRSQTCDLWINNLTLELGHFMIDSTYYSSETSEQWAIIMLDSKVFILVMVGFKSCFTHPTLSFWKNHQVQDSTSLVLWWRPWFVFFLLTDITCLSSVMLVAFFQDCTIIIFLIKPA